MDEKTSKRIAVIAGRLMKIKAENVDMCHRGDKWLLLYGNVAAPHNLIRDVRALAASCLTQTADKPKRGRK